MFPVVDPCRSLRNGAGYHWHLHFAKSLRYLLEIFWFKFWSWNTKNEWRPCFGQVRHMYRLGCFFKFQTFFLFNLRFGGEFCPIWQSVLLQFGSCLASVGPKGKKVELQDMACFWTPVTRRPSKISDLWRDNINVPTILNMASCASYGTFLVSFEADKPCLCYLLEMFIYIKVLMVQTQSGCRNLSRGHPKWWFSQGIFPEIPIIQV